MAEIRLEKLRRSFGDTVAVNDITTTFPASSVTCLLGPSGCGKTTLLRMIAGLEQQTSGEIYFGEERVTDLPPRKRNIGMVFQYPVVYKGISVFRNIELPLLAERLSVAERKQRVEQVIELLGLQQSAYKSTNVLDNAALQKVAMARAIARQPRIILFDEPITNVDVETKVQLKRALKELTRQLKQTILYVTHDQTEAMTLADEIVLMRDGDIVQRDTPRMLYAQVNNVFGGWFLGNPGMNFVEHEALASGDGLLLRSPLFPTAMLVSGTVNPGRITVGIRPEDVRVLAEPTPRSVHAQITRKTVVTGGQYLLTLAIGTVTIKAKVDVDTGRQLGGMAWVECPLDRTALFGEGGARLDAQLTAP